MPDQLPLIYTCAHVGLMLPPPADVMHGQVDAAAESIASDRITPVFAVSNVTGMGLPLLRAFVARLRRNKARNDDSNMPVSWTPLSIFQIFQARGRVACLVRARE